MTESQRLSSHYDVVIAGGGMVGASLALLLSVNSEQQLNILLVENFPLQINRQQTPQYSPSFDARSTALSYGSRLIFESVGVWQSLHQHVAAIESIHVSHSGAPGSTLMDKAEMDWPALGYVVENSWLGATLLSALAQQNNLTFAAPASVKSVQCKQNGTELNIEAAGAVSSITTNLLVVADGANSGLRKQLGITSSEKNYQQTALIANVGFSRPHYGRAYERFAEQGPLALLPLADSERGDPRAALVWSLPSQTAEEYLELAEASFLSNLQRNFGNRQGEFVRVGQRVLYPLKLIEATEQVRRGVVVMGNAAHSLHPVAGQGFNLALRDCARLTECICRGRIAGQQLGDLAVLQRYMDQQRFDQQKTVAFSDRLPTVFSGLSGPVGLLRDLAVGVLDFAPPLKRQFIAHAAGVNDGAAIGRML